MFKSKMWLIIDLSGIICTLLTYLVVLTVQFSFIRIGCWSYLNEATYWHFIVFQANIVLILSSHFKCMTTEPGVIAPWPTLRYA